MYELKEIKSMTDDEIKQLIGSNAKAIEALTNSFNEFKSQAEKDREQWKEEREEWRNERTGFYETMIQMQRQMIDTQRRIDDHNADIRELTIENQRILRYLENIVNRPEPPK
jgi:chromosome segregation ATPase